MKDRPAVALPKPRNARQVIDHASCEQKKLTVLDLAVRQTYLEASRDRYGRFHFYVPLFDPVLLELRAGQRVELGRRYSISGQIPVEGARTLIPRLPEIADQHTPAASSQHESGAQPRRPAADDDDVKRHGWAPQCKTLTSYAESCG
jgi:hypothetical protein